jgi:hypothetical protein
VPSVFGRRNPAVRGLEAMSAAFDYPLTATRLLRARCERPRRRRAADERDEFAPLHAEQGEFLPCHLASSPPVGLPHVDPAPGRWARSLGQA